MKTTIFVGLCAALIASFISVQAEDTPAQAAARAAWEQKLNELDHPQTQPPLNPAAPSKAVIVQPGQSTTNVTRTVPEKVVTPQPAAVPTKTQLAAAPAVPGPTPAPVATKPSSPTAMASPTSEIVTVAGVTYKNVRVEKVEWDGIIISFTPASGGTAMTKIYANELSDALRQKYGLDR
jgi:cytoskeletal protein RodZ